MASDGVNALEFFCFWLFIHLHIQSYFIFMYLDTYDWSKCVCFSLYGSLYVAPSLYGWVKLTTKMFPVQNFRTSLMKTVIEQLSYGPTATATFYFVVSLLEHKTIEESKQEVIDKFWPTYKVYTMSLNYILQKYLTIIINPISWLFFLHFLDHLRLVCFIGL